ncbi:hypothetical protein L9F63_003823, partial [Diploptera punctata]
DDLKKAGIKRRRLKYFDRNDWVAVMRERLRPTPGSITGSIVPPPLISCYTHSTKVHEHQQKEE